MDEVRLFWPGRELLSLPASCQPFGTVERHPATGDHRGDLSTEAPANRLYEGDNLALLSGLRETLAGRFTLLYADPPFGTGADFTVRTWIGGQTGGRKATPPEAVVESTAYTDRWEGGLGAYLAAMYPRIALMRDLLAEDGSLYLHVDARASHYLKVLLDEVFGPENFQREIIWRIGWVSGFKTRARNWVRNHDTILFYSKTPRFKFRRQFSERKEGYQRRGRDGGAKATGIPLEDVWTDLPSIQIMSFSPEKTGYATQKNENLLARIIEAGTDPGDLVGDFFCGSGTALVVAERLGRRWIGCDRGRLAVHTARKRLAGLPRHACYDICRPVQPVDQVDPPRMGDGAGPGVSWPEVILRRDSGGTSVALIESAEDLQLIDYWAVDFDYSGDVFTPTWQSHRTRRKPGMASESPCLPDVGRRIGAQLVDVYGNENLVILEA